MLFPILAIILIGMVVLVLRYRYTNKKTDDVNEEFYEREKRAGATPAKDISGLNYIKIPLDKFPIGQIQDDDIISIENKLQKLSGEDILNLTGKTNTDLKEEYGVPNFDKISLMGENFNELTIALTDYGNELMLHNMYDEAITVLEYGIAIGTDMSKNYTLLSDCYKLVNQPRRIHTLREHAERYEGIMRESILRHLDELLADSTGEEFELDNDTNKPAE